MSLATVAAVKNHLESNRQSTSLSLAYGSLTDEGVGEAATFVRDNPFTKYLDLRGNNVGVKGVTSIANGIKLNRSLRSLNLKWNAIGRDTTGVAALCEALKANLTIRNVDLQNNQINNHGARHLAEMLKINTAITHLHLGWNDLGPDGGLHLLEGLQRNSTLIECQLSGSKVGETTLHEVAFILRRNLAAAKKKAEDNPQTEEENTGDGAEPPEGGGWVRGRPRTAQDDKSLMLRLMMKEREQKLPEDKVFYRQIAEHITKLLLDAEGHKKGRTEGMEREKLSTAGFLEREQRYLRDVHANEEHIKQCIVDKADLVVAVARQAYELKQINDENAAAIRANIKYKEHAMAEEQLLRKELREIIQDKRDLTDKLALGNKDLELLALESERLEVHVETFTFNQQEILG